MNVAQKSQKTLFFDFFANIVQSVSKNVKKNTVFPQFSRNLAQKVKKNAVFRIFCELCTKCLEKREKTLFSQTFGGT